MCKDAATDVQKHIECRNAFRTCNKEARKTEGKVEGSVLKTGEPFHKHRHHKVNRYTLIGIDSTKSGVNV